MKNMMSQVKNFRSRIWMAGMIALAISALTLSGCEDPGTNNSQKEVEDPHWTLVTDYNMSMSMTVVANVYFSPNEGTLAAFINDDCVGLAENIDGLYILYIAPVDEAGGDVQLRFYSPAMKRIFVATETFPFCNDTILGTPNNPYTPSWSVAK